MKRKLIWLNVALIGLIAAASYRIREEWTVQQAREQSIRATRPTPGKPTVAPVTPPPAPVTAAAYSDIATKMLFSKERNPTVVVEAPVAPPKPMPALPLLHGVIGLPSGEIALMSMKPDSRSVGLKVGETIGEFELASLTRDEISFKWEDKIVTKSVSEMIYHAQEQTPAAPQGRPSASAQPANAPPAAGSPAAAAPAKSNDGPAGYKTCTPGDTSPAGTIADGYRKVLTPTPFGNSCHWEEVK